MAQSIKFKNEKYLDSSSIVYKRNKLNSLLDIHTLNIYVGNLSSGSGKDITSYFSDMSDRPFVILAYSVSSDSWRGGCIIFDGNYGYELFNNVCRVRKEGGRILIVNAHTTSLDFGTVRITYFYL